MKHSNAFKFRSKLKGHFIAVAMLSCALIGHAADITSQQQLPPCFRTGSHHLNIRTWLSKININRCPDENNPGIINVTIDGMPAGASTQAGVSQKASFPTGAPSPWQKVESVTKDTRTGSKVFNFKIPVYRISLQERPAPNIVLQGLRQARLARHPNGEPLSWNENKFGTIERSQQWCTDLTRNNIMSAQWCANSEINIDQKVFFGSVKMAQNDNNPVKLLWTYSVGKDISSSHPSVDFFIRSNDWHMASRRVFWLENEYTAAFYGQQITGPTPKLPNPEPNNLSSGFGVIGVNSIVFLDEAGEFFWDSNSKFLYYAPFDGVNLTLPGSAQLMSYIPEYPLSAGADRDQETSGIFVNLGTTSTVTIKNLYVTGINGTGIVSKKTSLTLDNVQIFQTSDAGVSLVENLDSFAPFDLALLLRINNSAIVETGSSGLMAQNCKVIVSNSKFHNSGLLGSQKFDLTQIKDENYIKDAGITQSSSNIRGLVLRYLSVTDSEFSTSGYAGIMSQSLIGPINIQNNKFSNYCMSLNDCGAVYMDDKLHQPIKTITGNTFTPGKSEPKGGSGYRIVPAIYLDSGTGYYTIQNNNMTVDSQFGAIYVHGGNFNKIVANTINNKNGPGLLMAKHPDHSVVSPPGISPVMLKMENNEVRGNWITKASANNINLGEVWYRKYTPLPATQEEIRSFGFFIGNNNHTPLKGTSSGSVIYSLVNGRKVMDHKGISVVPEKP